MKRYNKIILFSIVTYILLAIGAGYGIDRTRTEENNFYKVEINRIESSLSEGISLNRLSLGDYKAVKEVNFLPWEEKKQVVVKAFYEKKDQMEFEVRPWFDNQRLLGYLRFDYIPSQSHNGEAILWAELFMGVMGLLLITVLLYLKYHIIRPFTKISNMPYELAKGHYKEEIKEEKNRYFGKFLWGIGQLQDTLNVAKKRQLELEREKKKMLLSLSHEIKTPLNTIKLYGKALEEGIYEEEKKKKHAAHQIGEKTREIEQYIDEIMKTSKEDILHISVEMEDFYLADLMKKVTDVYVEKCHLRQMELKVERYENRLLKGDIDRAQEVFENIFENAFKYGDGRQIQVSFYEEDYCQLIRIINTGEPVTDHEINHIFESFFRGSNSSGQQGSGLGLYICKEIMHRMGGEIYVEKLDGAMAFVLVFQ